MDLIMLFKITHNLVAFRLLYSFFGLTNYSSTVGVTITNLLNLYVLNNNSRQFSFACRRIDAWNDLNPLTLFNALSLSTITNLHIKSCCFDRFVTIV